MERVAIGKNLLFGLVVALVLAIATIAFLLGRQTAQPAGATIVSSRPVLASPSPAPPSPPPPPPQPASVEAQHPEPASDDAAVAAYFAKMQAIQVESGGSDSKEYANQIMTAAMSGDASGFDHLAQQLVEAERRAQAVSVPAPCAQYHRSMLELLTESKKMIAGMQRAFLEKDVTAMSAVAANANGMQARTQAIEEEEKRLKTTYHVR